MARNNSGIFVYDDDNTETFDIAGSGDEVVDIDLMSVHNLQLLIEITYQSTSGTTGCDVDVIYGFGHGDAASPRAFPVFLAGTTEAVFSDTTDPLTMEPFTVSASPQTVRTYVALNELRNYLPRWVRLSFSNNEATTATVRIYYDI